MTSRLIGYIRTGTTDSNTAKKLAGLTLDKKFIDHASVAEIKRPNFTKLIKFVKKGDRVIVDSMCDISRNIKDLLSTLHIFAQKNVAVQFLKEDLVFNGDDEIMSKCILFIITALADFERALMKERQLEGIMIAKKAGKFKGRKTKFSTALADKIKDALTHTRKSKTKIAQELNISRESLYRYIKKMNIPS